MKKNKNQAYNLSTRQELELCYDYYIKGKYGEHGKSPVGGFNSRFYDFEFYPKDTFYGFILALRGFNGFPQVVTDELYKKIEERELYHGYKEYEHGAEMIAGRVYNLGTGVKSPGMYFSSHKTEAATYTDDNMLKYDDSKVLAVKYVGKCPTGAYKIAMRNFERYDEERIIKFLGQFEDTSKLEELLAFCKTLPEPHNEKFRKMFTSSLATLTAFLGYDYTYMFPSIAIVNNRAKLIISESEARRFLDVSRGYYGMLGQEIKVIDKKRELNSAIKEDVWCP